MTIIKNLSDIKMLELPTEWLVGPVNLYLIFGEKLTLVDGGIKYPGAWDVFNEFLNKKDLAVQDIEQVVLTHHHTDHIGMLDYLLTEHTVPIYAHRNCIPYLNKDASHMKNSVVFFRELYEQFGIPLALSRKLAQRSTWQSGLDNKIELTSYLEEGMTIPGLTEWQVIDTKGHAQSHISLFRKKDGVLLCGDHLIKHFPAGTFLEPPIYPDTERSKPLIQYVDNLYKLLKLPVRVALSGHGELIDDLPGLIYRILEKIDKRTERVKKVLRYGPKNGFELVQTLYPDRYEKQLKAYVSDTICLLDLLLKRQQIASFKKDGVIYYER